MAVARVHVRSWQAAYRKLMPDDYLDQLRPEDRAKKYNFDSLDPLQPHTIVLTESAAIRGFATTMPAQDLNMPDYGDSVLCMLIPTTGPEALALHLCRQPVLGFSIWDFKKRFSGYSKATFGRTAFIAGINGPPMEHTERKKCGASK
jgi:hypothetical protein